MTNREKPLKRRIFKALVTFTLTVSLLAVICVLVSSLYNMKKELSYDTMALDMVGDGIEAALDEGKPEPYAFVDEYSAASFFKAYFFAVIDTETGRVLSPSNLPDFFLTLDFSKARGRTLFFRHGKERYFAICHNFVKYPQKLIYVSSYRFAFGLTWNTSFIFLTTLLLLLAGVLLTSRFLIFPKVEETIRLKNKAEFELLQASQLQKMAITREFPSDSRCDMFGLLKPAREVGGDLYGCWLQGDRLAFIIGDVSDKGAQAAFVMFLLSSIAFPMFKEGTPIDEQVRTLNNVLCDNPNYDIFCTAIIGTLDLSTREMVFINAGHTRMLIDGQLYNATPNLPLGIIRDYSYVTDRMTLPDGATVVLYTDGVTEERSEKRELFGEDRFMDWWKQEGHSYDARKQCESLDARLDCWRGTSEQNDDRAIMVFKLNKSIESQI